MPFGLSGQVGPPLKLQEPEGPGRVGGPLSDPTPNPCVSVNLAAAANRDDLGPVHVINRKFPCSHLGASGSHLAAHSTMEGLLLITSHNVVAVFSPLPPTSPRPPPPGCSCQTCGASEKGEGELGHKPVVCVGGCWAGTGSCGIPWAAPTCLEASRQEAFLEEVMSVLKVEV